MKNIFIGRRFSLKASCILFTCLLIFCSCGTKKVNQEKKLTTNTRPNVILFYVDDLGYGDVGVYGAKGVKTPHLDALAKNGVMFTDAHCAAATCTPSRYSLLTGNYAFRRKAAVLKGDAPLLIDTASQTLPKVFQAAGYKTAVVGKWHLGLGYGDIDWNKHITPGPNEVGFDYSFLLPATGDRVPTVFVENGWVVNADPNDPIKVSYSERIDERPLGNERPDLLKQIADPQHSNTIVNGMSRIGYMTGGKSALWVDEDFPFIFTDKSKQFINESKDQPFFLFYSFHDIHVPRMPHDSFKDKSEMGPRGDAIVQVDWVVGQMVDELEKLGLIENTIIIFTSDNGPVLDDGYADQSEELLGAHQPGGIYRGGKYSAFEAGTRVPTIVSWKGEVAPKESNALVTQVDLLASMAKLVEQTVTQEVIDSEDQLAAWLGRSDQGREFMLEEAYTLAIRKGPWKYIRPVGYPTPQWLINKKVDAGLSQEDALYNLDNDPSEEINAAQSEAEIVKEMSEMLQQIVDKTTR